MNSQNLAPWIVKYLRYFLEIYCVYGNTSEAFRMLQENRDAEQFRGISNMRRWTFYGSVEQNTFSFPRTNTPERFNVCTGPESDSRLQRRAAMLELWFVRVFLHLRYETWWWGDTWSELVASRLTIMPFRERLSLTAQSPPHLLWRITPLTKVIRSSRETRRGELHHWRVNVCQAGETQRLCSGRSEGALQ